MWNPSKSRVVASVIASALISNATFASAQVPQSRVLKVISSDSLPVPYASVTINGGVVQIADEKGEMRLGPGVRQMFTLSVRRIGYQPWYSSLEIPDTLAVLTVSLSRIAQTLGTVNVTGGATMNPPLQRTGFYDRWLMRQKGTLSAVFIGPEEIDFRHPGKITDMLSGLNGVSLKRSCEGNQVAFGYGGRCQMTILVDGVRQCPGMGCNVDTASFGAAKSLQQDRSCTSTKLLDATTAVLIDQVLDANAVAAIEVYNRGGNMPVSLQASDQACGVIAFWTGARR
jgi:hypothetical protein